MKFFENGSRIQWPPATHRRKKKNPCLTHTQAKYRKRIHLAQQSPNWQSFLLAKHVSSDSDNSNNTCALLLINVENLALHPHKFTIRSKSDHRIISGQTFNVIYFFLNNSQMRHTYKNFSPSSIYNCAAILPFAIHSSTTRIGNTNCLFVFLHVTYSYISQCLVYKQYTIYEYFMGYLEIIFFLFFFEYNFGTRWKRSARRWIFRPTLFTLFVLLSTFHCCLCKRRRVSHQGIFVHVKYNRRIMAQWQSFSDYETTASDGIIAYFAYYKVENKRKTTLPSRIPFNLPSTLDPAIFILEISPLTWTSHRVVFVEIYWSS